MRTITLFLSILLFTQCSTKNTLKKDFINPPHSSLPGVYWYFMDGNLSRGEMTKDLESMKEVGISNVIFLEVGLGVPRGPVDFMSEEWQDLFVHAVREAERLGIKILLGAGPGWCGSGGPWVKPEEAMRHLVSSETEISGNKKIDIMLPVPEQRSTRWHKMKDPYYEDVAVYAIPASAKPVIKDINEKALYQREPYSSAIVKPHLPALAGYDKIGEIKILTKIDIIDIFQYLQEDGRLVWDAPEGNWTIVRMGTRVTGAGTRPAPKPVLGLESDKLSSEAFKNHLKNYTDILLEKTSPRKEGVGWTGFHMDSWESGAQNWTDGIIEEFKERRGYDPEPYFLTYTGRAVGSIEISERFLWDLRITCKELILENHAGFAKDYANKNGLELTIEPYDMNPAGDLDLGAVADVIMAEFPEGAPMVFTPPEDAMKRNGSIPDKRGYGFDGCSPRMLIERADVENGKIIFPGASSYEIMVLPNFETMTPELLKRITLLVEKGATIIASPPVKSPSLSNYPECDQEVKGLSKKLWGSLNIPDQLSTVKYGKGEIYCGGELSKGYSDSTLYPDYESTARILGKMNIKEDFVSEGDNIRFGHRRTEERDIYFVANRTEEYQKTKCEFRASGEPELWKGLNGESVKLQQYVTEDGLTSIDLEFAPYESFFIIFQRGKTSNSVVKKGNANFPKFNTIKTIEGAWDVAFDPEWGGPEKIRFDKLQDWTMHEMRGIKYYSGIATYTKKFDVSEISNKDAKLYLDLGVVNDIARVRINGKDIGVVWCAPWRVDISNAIVKGENTIEIEVANRWVNRLLGDNLEPDANVRTIKFENGLLEGKEYSAGRYTFTPVVANWISEVTELQSSGLLGPVAIQTED